MSVSLFSRLSKKIATYVLLAVVLPIAFLNWGGILRTLDLSLYDLGFRLRPTELMDERIVIVEWTEENLQVQEESTISDSTLASLIEKIQAQQPRLIAFDIFRDIPVASPNLTDRENNRAYDRLQNLFRTSPNLFGIEKVVEPKTNPPNELKKRNQIGAVDLPSDRDGLIRRAYTFPKLTKEGKPGGIPYLSVGLAQRYLAEEGWEGDMLQDNSLVFSNLQNSIIINPLKNFVGAYFDDRHGLDFLINWRKGNNLFRRVSAVDVTSNQIPPDLFEDRLVIIGNVSSATADRHTLPLNRWQRTDKIGTYGVETFGVEIIAQISSSVISAALDGRPLMKPASKFIETLLFLSVLVAIIVFIDKYRHHRQNLARSTFLPALAITSVIISSSLIAQALGWWLPVSGTIASLWIIVIAFTYYLKREREQRKIWALQKFGDDLIHNLDNKLGRMLESTSSIQIDAREVEYNLANRKLDIRENIEKLNFIRESARKIKARILIISKHKTRNEQFLRYCYLNIQEREQLNNINQTFKQIVGDFMRDNEDEIIDDVTVLQDYDRQINKINPSYSLYIGSVALKIIIENLLDNAFYAVAAQAKIAENSYLPIVATKTKLKQRKIEFIVEDNGVGIPFAFQRKIFLPFESYKNDSKSQGIGLHLAEEIVNSHGGKISVESTVGKGSKFIFTLPLINRNHTRFFNNFLSFFRKK